VTESSPPEPRAAAPTVLLERVHASDDAGHRGKSRGAIIDLTLALGPGVVAIVGAPSDGTLALLDVMTGLRPPTRGNVVVGGVAPLRSPATRARIGVLSPVPRLPDARDVSASVGLAMRARGEKEPQALNLLEGFGLGTLSRRTPRSLSYTESRAVELALALSTNAPFMVALYEPFSDLAMVSQTLLRERIAQFGVRGTTVVIVCSSISDARRVAERVLVLRKGRWAHEELLSLGAWPGGASEIRARLAEGSENEARGLFAALSQRSEITAVSWEDELVRIKGPNADACALALMDAAVDADIVIEAITLSSSKELT